MNRSAYVSMNGRAVRSEDYDEMSFVLKYPIFVWPYWMVLNNSDKKVFMHLVNNQRTEITNGEAREILGFALNSSRECLRRLCKEGLLIEESGLVKKKYASYYSSYGERDSYSATVFKVAPWVVEYYNGNGVKKE
jgi:hypothetical protein